MKSSETLRCCSALGTFGTWRHGFSCLGICTPGSNIPRQRWKSGLSLEIFPSDEARVSSTCGLRRDRRIKSHCFFVFPPCCSAKRMKRTRFFMRQKMKRGCSSRRSETSSSLSKIDTENNSVTRGQLGGSPGIYRPGFKTISWRMGVVLKTRG